MHHDASSSLSSLCEPTYPRLRNFAKLNYEVALSTVDGKALNLQQMMDQGLQFIRLLQSEPLDAGNDNHHCRCSPKQLLPVEAYAAHMFFIYAPGTTATINIDAINAIQDPLRWLELADAVSTMIRRNVPDHSIIQGLPDWWPRVRPNIFCTDSGLKSNPPIDAGVPVVESTVDVVRKLKVGSRVSSSRSVVEYASRSTSRPGESEG